MRTVRVLAQAARELEEAAAWYENEHDGLGTRLLDEFDRAVRLLQDDLPPLTPLIGEAGGLGAKRLLLHRFPFSIVVVDLDEELIVVAVAHQARRPGYWSERLGT
jgi:hypothetical protein